MAITQVQLYNVYQLLFKSEEPPKDLVIQYGVMEQDFDAADMDNNEYLSLEEGFNSKTISEFLYDKAASGFGDAMINSQTNNTSGLTDNNSSNTSKKTESNKPKTQTRKFGIVTSKKST